MGFLRFCVFYPVFKVIPLTDSIYGKLSRFLHLDSVYESLP